jgi:CheY-like chemotaxis protein
LVVDDDADIRAVLQGLLDDEGYHAICVENGEEALNRLRAGLRPCLILLDLMMPIMDGHRFRAQQVSDPSLANIPVVVITAGTQLGKVDPVAVLRKPFRYEELFARVTQFC